MKYYELRINTHGNVGIVPSSESATPIEYNPAYQTTKTIGDKTFVYRVEPAGSKKAKMYDNFFKFYERG